MAEVARSARIRPGHLIQVFCEISNTVLTSLKGGQGVQIPRIGTIRNAENAGMTPSEYKNLWDKANPNDPPVLNHQRVA